MNLILRTILLVSLVSNPWWFVAEEMYNSCKKFDYTLWYEIKTEHGSFTQQLNWTWGLHESVENFYFLLENFFACNLTFLTLLWFRFSWGNFGIPAVVMLWTFLPKTSKKMYSDEIFTWKVKKHEGTYTLIFLTFGWKISEKYFQ